MHFIRHSKQERLIFAQNQYFSHFSVGAHIVRPFFLHGIVRFTTLSVNNRFCVHNSNLICRVAGKFVKKTTAKFAVSDKMHIASLCTFYPRVLYLDM